MDFPITREQFKQWLEGQEGSADIGSSLDPWNCPLSCALHDVYKPRCAVLSYKWIDEDTRIQRALPNWAFDFRTLIDRYYPIETPISAAQALSTLEEIPDA